MFWNRGKKSTTPAEKPEPKWRGEIKEFGSNVYFLPANRQLIDHRGNVLKSVPFGRTLADYLIANPHLEVVAIASRESGGYTYDYTVVMRDKSA